MYKAPTKPTYIAQLDNYLREAIFKGTYHFPNVASCASCQRILLIPLNMVFQLNREGNDFFPSISWS